MNVRKRTRRKEKAKRDGQNRERCRQQTGPSLFSETLFDLAALGGGRSDSTFAPMPGPQRVAPPRAGHGANPLRTFCDLRFAQQVGNGL